LSVSKLWQLLFYTIVKLTIGMLCTIINDLGIVAYPTISIGCTNVWKQLMYYVLRSFTIILIRQLQVISTIKQKITTM
jgi:hypothetical protein